MNKVATYFNFDGQSEEALKFYHSIFGGKLSPIQRYKDMPEKEKASMPSPNMSAKELNMVLHLSLEIPNGHQFMATDVPPSMNNKVVYGSSVYVMLLADSKKQADEYFAKLSKGGSAEMPMTTMFWGDYFGSLVDKFGIKWMIDFSGTA